VLEKKKIKKKMLILTEEKLHDIGTWMETNSRKRDPQLLFSVICHTARRLLKLHRHKIRVVKQLIPLDW
jgi:hypothetical protein